MLGLLIQVVNTLNNKVRMDTITLGAGCFWCIEAVFQELNGVISVESGYSGGHIKNPSYEEVCSERTGHAEVCQIVYDEDILSLKVILSSFFLSHDPTTLNRQGHDIGSKYRSAIFYHTEKQRLIAEGLVKQLEESQAYTDPIVTEITAFDTFYKAENIHQDFYILNGEQPYCRFVIQPKLEKFRKVFGDKLKKK